MKNLMIRFARDEKGVTLVEYGIALILALVIGVGALTTLSGQIGTNMGDATTVMKTRSTTTP